jgi:hypothetical protein
MAILLAFLLLWAPQPEIRFSHGDARVLVRNAPGVSELTDRCLGIRENKWSDEKVVLFMVYDNCRENSVTRLVGPYFVDLRTGEVSISDPDNDPEESPRLKQVRESLLRKKAAAKTPGKAKTK